jgi:outer membrane biosynthesis protein TonB
VAWLLPELEVGVEPELRPLEEEDEPELVEPEEPELVEPVPVEPEPEPEPVEPEPVEPEPVEPEPVEPEPVELVPVLVEPVLVDEPVDVDASVLCVDPGRTRASAPAVTTLARLTALVAERTRPRPLALAATARRIPSRSAFLMYPILWSRTRSPLHESSR